MTRKSVLATIALGIYCLGSCSSTTPVSGSSAQTTSIEEISGRELGSGSSIEYNESKTYALCQQKKVNTDIIKYILINNPDGKITNRGQFRPGYAKWINNETVEILDAPGTIRKDQDLSDFIKRITLTSR